MMCCDESTETLQWLREAMAPDPQTGERSLYLDPGPDQIEHPLKPGVMISRTPNLCQLMIDSEREGKVVKERIGYVNTDPGGPIAFLKAWTEAEQEIILEAVYELLVAEGFDTAKPRNYSQPPAEGLVKPQEAPAEVEESGPLVLPE